MAMKYRIEYGEYSLYQKKSSFTKHLKGLLPVLVFGALVALLLYPPTAIKLRDLLLPGDPNVTMDAFIQLSDALDHGETLSDAMDVFCDAIMDVR